LKVRIDGETREYYTLWREGGTVKIIDQRRLPHSFEIAGFGDHRATASAIKDMVCRGAGAVGCAAAYAMAQAALEAEDKPLEEFLAYMEGAADTVRGTRPTAVNLFHAVERCLEAGGEGSVKQRVEKVLREADKVAEDDLRASRRMGEIGAELLKDGFRVLTHCNAGALAFIDHGTALSPVRVAHGQGKRVFVWVDETRPRCQGSRLTAWEMEQEGIPYAIIVDNAAGHYMRRGEVDVVIVGADRVAANGDVANKIGTYEKAVVAKANQIPFYVAAPEMTFDLRTPTGDDIEIEERSPEEVTRMWGLDEGGGHASVLIPAEGSSARNPAFDVTPSKYLTGFITEKGLIGPPYNEKIVETFRK